MTVTEQQNQVQENKPTDKELNFRALEAKSREAEKRAIEAERRATEAERMAQEALSRRQEIDDSDDNEPYVNDKKLNKTLAKFGEQTKQQTQSEIQRAVQNAIQEERRQGWLKNNPDFYEVMQHADKFAQRDPDLAESILEMPESFERQKLVYKNIKALGIHKPETKSTSVQEKIDANKRSPYYQPSGVGAAPYASAGDFSAGGQKQAYAKMQELKNRLRI
jgi:hypothetical protein